MTTTSKNTNNKTVKNNTSKKATSTATKVTKTNKAIQQPAAKKTAATTKKTTIKSETKVDTKIPTVAVDESAKESAKELGKEQGKEAKSAKGVGTKNKAPVKPKPATKSKPAALATKEQKELKELVANVIKEEKEDDEVRPNRKGDLALAAHSLAAQRTDSKNTKKSSNVNKVKKSIWSLNVANNAYKNGQYIKYDEIKNVTSLVVISKRTIDNFNNYKNDNDTQIPLLFINKDSKGNNIRLALYHNGSELDVANKVLNSFYSESEIKALVNNSINYTNFDEKILLNDIRERTSGGSSNRLPVPISELLFSADPKSFRNCVVIGADGTEKYMRRDKSSVTSISSSIMGNTVGNIKKQRTNLIQQLTEALETMYRIMYDETTTSRSKSSTKKYVNIDTLNDDGSGAKIGATAKSIKLTFNKEEDGEIIKGYYPIVCSSSTHIETARQLITSEPLTSWKAGSEDRDFLLENLNKLSLQFTNKGRKKGTKPTTFEETVEENDSVVNVDLDDKKEIDSSSVEEEEEGQTANTMEQEQEIIEVVQETANTTEQEETTNSSEVQEQETVITSEQEEVQKLSSPVMNTVSNLSPQRKRRGVNRR